ncbi:MAG: DUF4372 domain-containing protein [Kiritimatiellae bacterium]|nr:DUF4372 domain-containing protein [Kiritimatiellia bacterium]
MSAHKASLFSQLLSLFNRNDFSHHVREVNAEYRSKGFSCWDQFVAMLFCQLTNSRSLREITQGLQCCEGRLSHLGMSVGPARSTLAYANQHRPWQLFSTALLRSAWNLSGGRPRQAIPLQKQTDEPRCHGD